MRDRVLACCCRILASLPSDLDAAVLVVHIPVHGKTNLRDVLGRADRKILVFSQYDQACEERYRERNALTYCTLAASTLAQAGISDVSLLTANLTPDLFECGFVGEGECFLFGLALCAGIHAVRQEPPGGIPPVASHR
jgi:hypothetical protein